MYGVRKALTVRVQAAEAKANSLDALHVIRMLRADPDSIGTIRVVVVDENQLRSESIESHIANPNSVFVLPDAAIMEMAKSPQWEWMMRRALTRLSRVPTRVAMTIGNGELLRLERQRQVPLKLGDLLDTENTNHHRGAFAGNCSRTAWTLLRLGRAHTAGTAARDGRRAFESH